jgi:hypothetical protein
MFPSIVGPEVSDDPSVPMAVREQEKHVRGKLARSRWWCVRVERPKSRIDHNRYFELEIIAHSRERNFDLHLILSERLAPAGK